PAGLEIGRPLVGGRGDRAVRQGRGDGAGRQGEGVSGTGDEGAGGGREGARGEDVMTGIQSHVCLRTYIASKSSPVEELFSWTGAYNFRAAYISAPSIHPIDRVKRPSHPLAENGMGRSIRLGTTQRMPFQLRIARQKTFTIINTEIEDGIQ